MERNFIPGSEWLFLKFYTGHKSGDRLLTEQIGPMCGKLTTEGVVDGYFFIRYSDTAGFHIRLRLHIPHAADYGRVFESLYETFSPWVDNGRISGIQCDTYKRELERYGEESIADAEELFCIDSLAVLSIVDGCRESGNDDELRWKCALLLVDDLLEVFGYDTEGKAKLTENGAAGYKSEFRLTKAAYTAQLNDRYRALRSEIDKVMSRAEFPETMLATMAERKERMRQAVARLMEKMPSDEAGNPVPDSRVMSYVHMTVNRLFRSKNRMYEMMMYEFLRRHYASVIARSKNTGKKRDA